MLITRVLCVLGLLGLGACGGSEGGGSRVGGDGDGTGGLSLGGGGTAGFGNSPTGTGAASGGGGTIGGGGVLEDGTCDRVSVSAAKADPEFLIVLDKSGSMGGLDHPACQAAPADCTGFLAFLDARCGTGTYDRWTPSVNALANITGQLDATIPFGLMMYPSDGECGATEIQVPIGLGTSAAIKGVFDNTCPQGRTPTSAALLAARDEFMARSGGPDAAPTAPYVLLVTDGAPNCVDGGDPDQATWDAVEQLAQAGIRTYVIGYDTKNDAGLAQVLDEAARRGGTGDMAHRPVEDEASLTTEFQSIAMNAVSCTYVLNEEVKDAAFVLVKLNGTQINLDEPDGWSLGADKISVTLTGASCNTLQDGNTNLLDISVECDIVVPQ